jgi:lipoic acid synthetase
MPPSGERYFEIKRRMRALGLATVCEEAQCPNVGECWSGGTATFMLMGDTCTRGCRFCAVTTGKPEALDPMEPRKVAVSVKAMELDYVVITSVNRDELPDGGAAHFAATVRAVRAENPKTLVEVLIPDFQGDRAALAALSASEPDVTAHNVETVERLTPEVRDRRASYRQSLAVLQHLKDLRPRAYTKSSLMLGLGEAKDEIHDAMRDLRSAGVDLLTLGQYLQPAGWNLPVHEYLPPERFAEYERMGLEEGFLYVASGPLVRSSYRAGEFFMKSLLSDERNSHAEETKYA